MAILRMKPEEAAIRILKHIKKYGASTMNEFIYCDDSHCCDDEMTYGRFHNGRSYIGHIYLFAHDEPFISRYDYGKSGWVYDLPKHWNEAVMYLLWQLKHLATRADGFYASAKATNGKFSIDPTVDAGIKMILAILQHDGERLRNDINFVKKQLASVT